MFRLYTETQMQMWLDAVCLNTPPYNVCIPSFFNRSQLDVCTRMCLYLLGLLGFFGIKCVNRMHKKDVCIIDRSPLYIYHNSHFLKEREPLFVSRQVFSAVWQIQKTTEMILLFKKWMTSMQLCIGKNQMQDPFVKKQLYSLETVSYDPVVLLCSEIFLCGKEGHWIYCRSLSLGVVVMDCLVGYSILIQLDTCSILLLHCIIQGPCIFSS